MKFASGSKISNNINNHFNSFNNGILQFVWLMLINATGRYSEACLDWNECENMQRNAGCKAKIAVLPVR